MDCQNDIETNVSMTLKQIYFNGVSVLLVPNECGTWEEQGQASKMEKREDKKEKITGKDGD